MKLLPLASLVSLVSLAPVTGATLASYYNFEGTGADRFADSAGAFADDLDYAAGQASQVFSSDTAGISAGTQSASFNGTDVLATNSYSTDLGPGMNAMTIMFWIKAADA